MLQRLQSLDEELYPGCGLWSRGELEAMNQSFVTAMEQAFASGGESRAAGSATVRIAPRVNGGRQSAAAAANGKGAAIGGVWRLFVEAKFDMTAVEVMERARAVCPYVTAEDVREEFKRRLASWISSS